MFCCNQRSTSLKMELFVAVDRYTPPIYHNEHNYICTKKVCSVLDESFSQSIDTFITFVIFAICLLISLDCLFFPIDLSASMCVFFLSEGV